MSDQSGPDHDSRVDLNIMLDSIKRHAPEYFRTKKTRAIMKLPNGYVVVVTIEEPKASKRATPFTRVDQEKKP